jgi:hypothetical protein
MKHFPISGIAHLLNQTMGVQSVEVEEQVSHVIKLYLRNLRRPLKKVRGFYIYMK